MKLHFLELFALIPIDRPIAQVMGLIGGLLISASISSGIWKKQSSHPLAQEIWVRTRSWWIMSIGFFAGLLIHPHLSFFSLALLSFMVLRELFSIFPLSSSERPAMILGYVGLGGIYFLLAQHSLNASQVLTLVFLIGLMGVPSLLLIKGNTLDFSSRLGSISLSIFLAVGCLSYLALLLQIPQSPELESGGKGLLLYVVCVVELNDVSQFMAGKFLGKRKLIPTVSPGKTVEGFIGGMLGSVLIASALSFLTPFSPFQAGVIGALLSAVGLLGDLLLSAIKRDRQLKDTGKLIPGHGGILDRVDSLLFTAPIFYYAVLLS